MDERAMSTLMISINELDGSTSLAQAPSSEGKHGKTKGAPMIWLYIGIGLIVFLWLVLRVRAYFRHGKYLTHHSNGNKQYEGEYDHGKRIGLWIYWAEEGYKSSEDNYVKGKKHGMSRTWYSKGQLASEDEYVNGKLHGRHIMYLPDGKTEETGQYENGKRHGKWRMYLPSGALDCVEVYEHGKLSKMEAGDYG
jgi:hypothetical protein